ncbi:hypothetical protein GGE16_001513 [Rhizobium leguminosarum]|uniref:Uncharacterized protein n=1 Tax=Rhizobium leguminosarum TaxID=384 RepID=A0AAE2SVG8_RHILE|nr:MULTISPECIES: hypothetical protein [Rhizobium]MBB4289497.1 hypothetical protein [Rhizobium leguminosarum]MBB4294407.1 hypothetical protein [Rhizobium leguminosarum]MBB4305803.1 hypothetical protein [Rhizobium leguminosarum]MBB4418620.1 hypothetical protein [Rhizobium leguminosarum]MBB4433464.1 hypothetical protein [Rhizobium esperanzae]
MGGIASAPINEAVFFLSKASPEDLEQLKNSFPEIKDELNPGIMAGEADLSPAQARTILKAKAQVIVVVLNKTIELSDRALSQASRKMRFGRRTRMGGQVITVVGTSGVLAAIGITQNGLAIASAILALLGSLAAILGEYFEQIVDKKQGGLNEIFLRIATARHKAVIITKTIETYIREDIIDSGLETTIREGNALSEEITSNVYQIFEAFDVTHGR